MKKGSTSFLFKYSLFIVLLLSLHNSKAQQKDTLDYNPTRLKYSIAATSFVYATTLYSLNKLWYADFEKSSFHFFNDNKQWKQQDKVGHIYSSYLGGYIGYSALKYSGLSNKKSALYGGGLGFLFLSTVEVFDGYSSEWGFSWGDIASNGIGTGLFIGQELLFEEQILKPKYSFTSSEYRALRPNVLGANTQEAYFKDYNAQTYWLSLNLNSLNHNIKPKWLALAFGYGANGMVNASGTYINKGLVIEPYRQCYLSFDVDFTKIETEKKWVKSLLKAANFIKVPAPSIEFNQNRKTNFYWLFF